MTQADLAKLVPGVPKIKSPAALRFRESHHMMARLFASGMRVRDVSAATGYAYNRVATLHSDPSFIDLIAKYMGLIDAAFAESMDAFAETAMSNMVLAESLLRDRLTEAAEGDDALPVKDLVSIVSDRADRFGYGKRATQVNLNVDFASMLDKAIKRSARARPDNVIDLPERGVVPGATRPSNGEHDVKLLPDPTKDRPSDSSPAVPTFGLGQVQAPVSMSTAPLAPAPLRRRV